MTIRAWRRRRFIVFRLGAGLGPKGFSGSTPSWQAAGGPPGTNDVDSVRVVLVQALALVLALGAVLVLVLMLVL
eukprot:10814598-Alexandrium_andersonii.AAC.1